MASGPIYPKAREVAVVVPIDEATCAQRIIEQREAIGKALATRGEAVGPVLAGSDDVATFERLWREIEEERIKLSKVDPSAFNTAAEYKTALGILSRHLDPVKWLDGLKAEKNVTTWAALVDATKPATL